MLVVPLAKDSIETNDGSHYKVVEYTNYKDGGPAVYAKASGSKDLILVYFFDIKSIEGTKVEYQRGSRIFKALGKIDRDYHLPQPDDKVIISVKTSSADESSKQMLEVDTLKLKSKQLGVNKGLHFKDLEGNYHRLKQIFDIDPALGGDIKFNRDDFLSYYSDYTGL